jgi:hypothetical protein
MWHAWGRGEVFTRFRLGGPKGRDHWEDLGVEGRITLRWTLDGSMRQTGFGWLKTAKWRTFESKVISLRVP